MTRFAILAAPRTGGNLLCSLLDAHPDILCHHEIFNPKGIRCAHSLRRAPLDLGSMTERDRDPLFFLDRVWNAPRGHASVGFKMSRGQSEIVLRSVLADTQIRKIVLRRRNRLKTFVSERIALETGQWEVYDAADLPVRRNPVRILREDLERHVALNERFYEELMTPITQGEQPWMEIYYEDLLSLDEQCRLLAFLSVDAPSRPLAPESVKQNTGDLRALIANFSELDATLESTEFHAELHDPTF